MTNEQAVSLAFTLRNTAGSLRDQSTVLDAEAAILEEFAATNIEQPSEQPEIPPPAIGTPVLAQHPASSNLVQLTPAENAESYEQEHELYQDGSWVFSSHGPFLGDGSYHPGGRIRVRGVSGSQSGEWSNYLEAV